MVRKRIMSVLLVVVMMLSMSSEVFAAVLNLNTDGENTVQVQTDTEQFFNVVFAPEEWEPNAEDYDVIYMGRYYDMWHFGNMNI